MESKKSSTQSRPPQDRPPVARNALQCFRSAGGDAAGPADRGNHAGPARRQSAAVERDQATVEQIGLMMAGIPQEEALQRPG